MQSIDFSSSFSNLSSPPSLADSLANLIADAPFADISVVVDELDGKTEISSHKAILCARSPVLKAMLTSGLSESTSSEISISDFSAEVVRTFLPFLYTDQCVNGYNWTIDFNTQVMMIAHKYQVQKLIELCEVGLSGDLKLDNVQDN